MNLERSHWDAARFADSCAGCHATAVDPKEKAFAAVSLDCFTCHGRRAGRARQEAGAGPPVAETEGRGAGRDLDLRAVPRPHRQRRRRPAGPYPTNFVAGDNLFRDFRADFSDEALKALSTADRHVMENVRDVVVFGREAVTCLSCHDVHGRSSKKHHRVPEGDNCSDLPQGRRSGWNLKPFSNFSKTCGY